MTREQWLRQFRKDLFSAAFDIDICGFENVSQIANAAGLSYQTVENIRSGKTKRPSVWTVRQLCIATGTDVRIVMGDLRRTKERRRAA